MSEPEQLTPEVKTEKKTGKVLFSICTWGLTAACIYLVWGKIDDAAARENQKYRTIYHRCENLWSALFLGKSVKYT